MRERWRKEKRQPHSDSKRTMMQRERDAGTRSHKQDTPFTEALTHTKTTFGAAYTKAEPLIVYVAVAYLRPINYDDAGRRKARRECVQSDKAGRTHMNLMDVSKRIRTLMHLKKKKGDHLSVEIG